MYPYHMMGFGFGIFDFIGHILLIVFVIWFVMMLLRRPRGGMGRWHMHDMWQQHSALSILNERYAKGEIDKAEYEERKKTLMS